MKITQVVAEYGAKNLRFFFMSEAVEHAGLFPMFNIGVKVHGSPQHLVEYEIDESRYDVTKNHMIMLTPANPMQAVMKGGKPGVLVFGNERFFISDLEGLIREGTHRVYVLTIDGYQKLL